ncbi:unnamed protein product [Larinioides sclopetarius]|uniref:Uncharacterized protein n=1 Tax=Larinioides sclopetarius TaxID=280406 RepID=A0AAV1YQK9_9ARAC
MTCDSRISYDGEDRILGPHSNVSSCNGSRLNQDCLENFFSQIRGVGHFYDHPLPSEVKHRIRLLLLGKNVDDIPFSSATNTLPCEDKSVLTTELLVHMSPDLNECGNQSEIQEIITNEVSSSELTAIVDSSECLNVFSPDCCAEGLKYLAGYIAHKCRKYDRSLAIPSGQSLAISSKEKTWIEVLSRGGLLIPTDEWFEQIKKNEETYREMHCNNHLSTQRNQVGLLNSSKSFS